MLIDPCEQPVISGPCKGNYSRWYYDKSTQKCSSFNYGGCKGSQNNFISKESCNHKCINPLKIQGECDHF